MTVVDMAYLFLAGWLRFWIVILCLLAVFLVVLCVFALIKDRWF